MQLCVATPHSSTMARRGARCAGSHRRDVALSDFIEQVFSLADSSSSHRGVRVQMFRTPPVYHPTSAPQKNVAHFSGCVKQPSIVRHELKEQCCRCQFSITIHGLTHPGESQAGFPDTNRRGTSMTCWATLCWSSKMAPANNKQVKKGND